MVSAIFGHAVRKGILPNNPALSARKLSPGRRVIRLSLRQVEDFGAALREAQEHPTGKALIRFLLLTGLRISEARGAKAEDLRFDGGLILHDTKTEPQIRPVGKAALAPFHGYGKGLLFPRDAGEKPFATTSKILERVSAKAGLTGITPHILRHSYASIAGDLGYSELTIDGLLGHGTSGAGGYVHLDTSLVAAADRVSAVIAAALDGETAKIVTFSERVEARA